MDRVNKIKEEIDYLKKKLIDLNSDRYHTENLIELYYSRLVDALREAATC